MSNNDICTNVKTEQEETLPSGGVEEYEDLRRTRKTRVYVAMPCSDGERLPMADRWINMIKAIEVCNQLWLDDYLPFCPHLTIVWDVFYNRKYEDCLDYDRPWQELCDCTLRLGSTSSGADGEVQYAKTIKQPTFINYGELLEKMPKEIEI